MSDKSDATTGRHRRFTTLALMFLCHGLSLLGIGSIALFLPLIRADLGLTYTQAGVLSASSTLVYALMQMPAGALADRVGTRRVFLAGMLGHNVVIGAVGTASAFGIMTGLLGLSGFFRSFVFLPGFLLLAGWFEPHRRATAMSGFMAATFVFSSLLALVGPAMVEFLGWRPVVVALGVAGVVAALAFARWAADSPHAPLPQPTSWSAVFGLLRNQVMWVLGALQFIRLAIVYSIWFWMPTYLVDDVGLTLIQAGFLIAAAGFLGAPSNLIGGYVSDRTGTPVLVICGSFVVLALTLTTMAMTVSLPLVVVAVVFTFLFMQFYFGSIFAVTIDTFGARTAGLTSGFGNFFATIGSFVSGLALGLLRDRTDSFAWGFGSLAGLAVVGVLLGLWLGRLRNLN